MGNQHYRKGFGTLLYSVGLQHGCSGQVVTAFPSDRFFEFSSHHNVIFFNQGLLG